MRKQKRYTTEQQILDAIDEAHQRHDELIKQSNECPFPEDAAKFAKAAHRIEDVRLPKLKNALAEFRTGVLESITTDRAVVL
jgi:hypothetical protein